MSIFNDGAKMPKGYEIDPVVGGFVWKNSVEGSRKIDEIEDAIAAAWVHYAMPYFATGYIECLLWSSTDDNGEPLDGYELSDAAREKCEKDCREFIAGNLVDLQEYAERYQPSGGFSPWECAGHDFWLTRNGHGTGFWDRGLGELGKRLTKAAKVYGSCDAYLNDESNEVEI